MRFSVAPEVFRLLPDLRVGVAVARGLRNDGDDSLTAPLLRTECARRKAELSAETISIHPRIDVWRNAYRAFGAKPKEHRSSIESLCRAVLRSGEVRSVNPLVDLYNAISLRHMIPAGGEDLDEVRGDIALAVAGDHEPPVRLLGDAEARPPHPGELIYRDSVSALCRRLNWREADRTKLTAGTRNAVLVLEALPPIGDGDLRAAGDELMALVRQVCGGEIRFEILSVPHPDIAV